MTSRSTSFQASISSSRDYPLLKSAQSDNAVRVHVEQVPKYVEDWEVMKQRFTTSLFLDLYL